MPRAPSAASGAHERALASRRDRQGLSAPFGDLHRAGASGARAPRLFHRHLVAAPTDRRGRACAQPGRAGETPLPAGISLSGAAARVARLPARDALAGVFAHDAGLPSRSSRATSPPIADAASARPASLRASFPPDIAHLHVHYLHTPGSVARYASLLTGRGFSFSAHAKDIWTTPDWEKREKIADAHWGVTCTRQGFDELSRVAEGKGSRAPRSRLSRHRPRADAASAGITARARRLQSRSIRSCCSRSDAWWRRRASTRSSRPAATLPSRASLARRPSSAPAPCARSSARHAAALGLADRVTFAGALAQDQVDCGAQSRRSLRPALPGRREGGSRRASERHPRGGLPGAARSSRRLTRRCRNSSRTDARACWSRPSDPSALSGALAALISDPARRFGARQGGPREIRAAPFPSRPASRRSRRGSKPRSKARRPSAQASRLSLRRSSKRRDDAPRIAHGSRACLFAAAFGRGTDHRPFIHAAVRRAH